MVVQANRSTSIHIDGNYHLYFGGTNYLGLAHNKKLQEAATEAFDRFGFSAGASRLTSGENELLIKLEQETASFARAQACLVVPAGFMSNQAAFDGLDPEVDAWLIHEQAHGSILSAVSGTRKPVIKYTESELADGDGLRSSLRQRGFHRVGIFVEPINPLLGKLFPLDLLLALLRPEDFLVMDEAHSFGILGDTGYGASELYGLDSHANVIVTGTYSKAVGTGGGFVIATHEIIEKIKSRSACYKVSTPLNAPTCAATLASLELITHEKPIQMLRQNITVLNEELVLLGHDSYKHNTVPIFNLPNNSAVGSLRDALPAASIFIPSVTRYFADFCEIGLRWTIQAGHTADQLQRLIRLLKTHLHPAT